MLVAAGMTNIHAGNGANRAFAGEEILELAEYLSSPVTNNASARGIIPEDHDLAFPPTVHGLLYDPRASRSHSWCGYALWGVGDVGPPTIVGRSG